jgi:DNA polymerase-3 subunit epsilon
MPQIEKQLFICLDCETTGLDPRQDRIVEVAAVLFNSEEIFGQFESLVDPECVIPESSIAIHHITPEMVAGKPKIQELIPELLKFIGNHIIIGHGVGFDVEAIASSADRASLPCVLRNNKIMDTLRLARLYGESPVNSLEKLRQHFNIEAEGAHRAMSDVIVNVDVFKYLCKKFRTTEQVFDVLSRPILMRTMPLGPHKGRQMKDIPLEYLRWAANKDFDQDLLYSLRSELKKRKKGGLFGQASNPFQNL